MKTSDKFQKKNMRNYAKPEIVQIRIDNDICIFMDSSTPPDESVQPPDHFSLDPFKFMKL
jgi:hypothetical protein